MAPRRSNRAIPVGVGQAGTMTMDEMKERYRVKLEQICRLEAERAEAIGRGDPVPRRVQFNLDMTRIEAEELRMWGNRELTRQIRERHEPQLLSGSRCTYSGRM